MNSVFTPYLTNIIATTLYTSFEKRIYKKRECMILRGDSFFEKYAVILLKGSISVFYEPKDKNYYMFTIHSNELAILNGPNILFDVAIEYTAYANEVCEVLIVPKVEIMKLRETHMEFRNEFMKEIKILFEKLWSNLLYISKMNLEDLLCNYLMHKLMLNDDNEIVVNKNEIAFDLGVSREAISRTLKKLELQNKIIRKIKSVILIPQK